MNPEFGQNVFDIHDLVENLLPYAIPAVLGLIVYLGYKSDNAGIKDREKQEEKIVGAVRAKVNKYAKKHPKVKEEKLNKIASEEYERRKGRGWGK